MSLGENRLKEMVKLLEMVENMEEKKVEELVELGVGKKMEKVGSCDGRPKGLGGGELAVRACREQRR